MSFGTALGPVDNVAKHKVPFLRKLGSQWGRQMGTKMGRQCDQVAATVARTVRHLLGVIEAETQTQNKHKWWPRKRWRRGLGRERCHPFKLHPEAWRARGTLGPPAGPSPTVGGHSPP